MEFNADKCFILNITRKRHPMLNKYQLHDTILQTVKTATYLGIGCGLHVDSHINVPYAGLIKLEFKLAYSNAVFMQRSKQPHIN